MLFWGKFKTIMVLSICYCLGHGCLAFMGFWGDSKVWLLLGLGLIAIGSGGIKPCVSSHVGDQFCKKNSHLISKVFGWFYFFNQFWSFRLRITHPIPFTGYSEGGYIRRIDLSVCCLFSRAKRDGGCCFFGHHYAFGLPGVLMGVATILFWWGRQDFAHIPPRGKAFLGRHLILKT